MNPAPLSRDRAAAINIDIDGLHLYYRIHGLREPGAQQSIYLTGVRRFLDLLKKLDLRATFFAVGEDLLEPQNRPIIDRLVAEGHELASHSFTHPYRLIQQTPSEQISELQRTEGAIAALTGAPPRGFRAPGYNTSVALLELLAERGYAYDSSLLPCPAYLLARAAMIAWYKARGRQSHSLAGDWRAMTAPRLPYWRTLPSGRKLLELPITVLPGLRLPLIGTSALLGGDAFSAMARPWLKSVPFVNFELHAIDLCDAAHDGIDPALREQPDLRLPVEHKWRIIEEWCAYIAAHWRVSTLAELADTPHI